MSRISPAIRVGMASADRTLDGVRRYLKVGAVMDIIAEEVEVTRGGATMKCHVAGPATRERYPALLFAIEAWGLNEQIKRTADRLHVASQGTASITRYKKGGREARLSRYITPVQRRPVARFSGTFDTTVKSELDPGLRYQRGVGNDSRSMSGLSA